MRGVEKNNQAFGVKKECRTLYNDYVRKLKVINVKITIV